MNTHARLAALLALAAFALPVSAKTYYVDDENGDDANTGLSATAAFATIQKAIDKAAAGSTILVAPGTYAPIKTNNKKLTIKSTAGADVTIIYGENDPLSMGANLGKWVWKKFEWVYTGNATTLSGFTIRGCGAAVMGGKFMHGVITENVPQGENGGLWSVIYYSDVTDSRIDNNGDTELSLCILMYFSSVNRCVITRNRSGGDYGVAFQSCRIDNSLVADNRSSNTLFTGTRGTRYPSTLYNSTVVSNWQETAALYCCNVFNSIVWGNRSTMDGEEWNLFGFTDDETGEPVAPEYMNYHYEGHYYKAHYTMMNSLVGNTLKVYQTGNKGTYDGAAVKNSTGNITGDPLFIDPENGDYHLAPNSPCVNAGADYTKKTGKFDLDSGARKVGKVDMGAYELQPQTAVPADYDGDGVTDAAFYFAPSGQWWIFGSKVGLRTISLPDRNGVPCPADYDGDGKAEPSYFTAAAKTPEFVRVALDGTELERKAFGTKGATPVAVRFSTGKKATFGVYTANAKKPVFSFLGNPLTATFGAKASCPVVADFDNDKKDDIGVYTATASKPAFAILQSSQNYATTKLFNGEPVPLGAKGAIPCCADFDGIGGADFGVYLSNAKEPYFSRLFSSSQFRETRTLPMGSKGDIPVVGVYESGKPATPAVWTGTTWTYLKSDYSDGDLFGE